LSYAGAMTLQEESQRYHTIGEKFLEESGLAISLQKHGEVRYEGAYAANLMMHGDIDIRVVRDKPFSTEDAFAVFKDVFFDTNPKFRSYYVKSDWEDPRFGNQYPYGHYLGARAVIEGEVWKFDIWLIGKEESARLENREGLDIVKTDLTEKQRETILAFKKYRKENNIAISGQRIYEAVIKEGLSDPAKLIA
jgi:hypothetical protein